MAELLELARPVVTAAARLQPDLRRSKLLQEAHQLPAPQLAFQHRLIRLVDTVQLEHALRRVDPDPCYLRHGRLPRIGSLTNPFWHSDAVGGRPPQRASRPAHDSDAGLEARGPARIFASTGRM